MERDFMGLNSRDSVVVVKEEAVEGCKDSGVQWPLSNKVSAFPHFMSFKVAQEEKAPKATSDPVASSGYMTISTPDAFDATHKRQVQQVSIGQGGTHFSMTTYPEQHNAVSVHLSHDVKMAAANQPVSVSIGNPLFTTHFLGAAQNFAGATAKTPIVAPHSISPSLGSVAGTTEPWFNSKSSGAPPQLTIFYAGTVNVYNDISPEKAQAIMFLAGNGSTPASKMAQPRAQAQVPVSIQAGGGDGVLINQRTNTPTGSGLSSAMSVSSHPVGQCGNGTTTNHELMGVKPTGASNSNPQNVVTSLGPAATIMTPSAIPQARQASLARFLEKRKERVMNSAPYLTKKSTEFSSP
ncbi:protein TIFY 6B-like isoform X1 [Rhododendron vialii]|uniref:protein TIFY 6B-like isoform X1 n=1 Tax=Rhododendron vialii TaxID=182163 RepID=UPI00265EE9B7|nr:protein TIFY 6B-like isoform X1 [Rhododendron vialii]